MDDETPKSKLTLIRIAGLLILAFFIISFLSTGEDKMYVFDGSLQDTIYLVFSIVCAISLIMGTGIFPPLSSRFNEDLRMNSCICTMAAFVAINMIILFKAKSDSVEFILYWLAVFILLSTVFAFLGPVFNKNNYELIRVIFLWGIVAILSILLMIAGIILLCTGNMEESVIGGTDPKYILIYLSMILIFNFIWVYSMLSGIESLSPYSENLFGELDASYPYMNKGVMIAGTIITGVVASYILYSMLFMDAMSYFESMGAYNSDSSLIRVLSVNFQYLPIIGLLLGLVGGIIFSEGTDAVRFLEINSCGIFFCVVLPLPFWLLLKLLLDSAWMTGAICIVIAGVILLGLLFGGDSSDDDVTTVVIQYRNK